MARSPYDVPYRTRIRNTVPTRSSRGTAHLGELETESRAENDGEKTQPAETKFRIPRQAVKGLRDEGAPDGGNRLAHDRVGNEPESNDPGKRERNGQLKHRQRRLHTTVGKNFLSPLTG